MAHTIAVYGGSFNPPCQHHRAIAQELALHFDELVIVPCGPRLDRPSLSDTPPVFRAALADLAFAGLAGVRVDLFDLESDRFSRTHELQQRYETAGEVWHVVDADWLAGGGAGQSLIQRVWDDGPRLWRELAYAVLLRPGQALDPADRPPRCREFSLPDQACSDEVRERVFNHRSIDGLVPATVERFIWRHGLYREQRPVRRSALRLEAVRPLVLADPWNAQAVALAARLGASHEQEPDLIVVVGGDGTMLRAIRREWRRRVPFYGIHTGHLGFLLNRRPPSACLGQDLVLEHLPLLRVECHGRDGPRPAALAFNDAWVERATGQAAWLRVEVNERPRLPRLVADGALIATAAGSTAYARAMGATPVPLSTQALILVGSNVLRPAFLRPVVLPLDARVELRTLDPERRPLRGYIDGEPQDDLLAMTARVSRVAAVELAFDPAYDPAEKLAAIQFPSVREEDAPEDLGGGSRS